MKTFQQRKITANHKVFPVHGDMSIADWITRAIGDSHRAGEYKVDIETYPHPVIKAKILKAEIIKAMFKELYV